MQNQPLNSSEQGKLLIFILLMIPAMIFIVGIIPAVFLVFGIYMMKRNQDFSSVDTAVKYFKGYTYLAMIVGVISMFIILGDNGWRSANSMFELFLTLAFIFVVIPVVYLKAVQYLFYSPLKEHGDWVSVNGVFSTKQSLAKKVSAKPEMDIIKGEKLTQYSVADELMKWAKLKEDGYITEEEFNEARAKLLGRN